MFSAESYAYTECPESYIDKIHVGDNENVFIYYVGGGSTNIPPSNVNQKNALSVALSAFMGNKKVKVRYNSDGVLCTDNLVNDFRGLWLLKD